MQNGNASARAQAAAPGEGPAGAQADGAADPNGPAEGARSRRTAHRPARLVTPTTGYFTPGPSSAVSPVPSLGGGGGGLGTPDRLSHSTSSATAASSKPYRQQQHPTTTPSQYSHPHSQPHPHHNHQHHPSSSHYSSSTHSYHQHTSSAGQHSIASTNASAGPSSIARRGSTTSMAGNESGASRTGHGASANVASTRLSSQSVRKRRSSSAQHTPPSPSRASSSGHARTDHVMALTDFDGSIMASQSSSSSASTLIYLSFRGGDYIRVINRDPSGWWDGEIDNRRGWFPSNYVKAVDWEAVLRPHETRGEPSSPRATQHDSSRSYAEARSRHASTMSHASYASHASHASHTSQHSYSNSSSSTPLAEEYNALLQPAIAALTAYQRDIREQPSEQSIGHYAGQVLTCVRAILQRTGCMHRSSGLLRNPAIHRARTSALNGLTDFVNSAKTLQADGAPYDPELIENSLNEATTLFGVIRRFVAVANDLNVPVTQDEGDGTHDASLQQTYMSRRVRVPSNGNSSSANAYRLKSASTNDLRGAARRRDSSPPPPLPNTSSTRGSTAVSPYMATSSGRSSPIPASRRRPRTSPATRHNRSASYEQLQSDISPDMVVTSPELSQSTSAIPSRRDDDAENAVKTYANGQAVHEAVAAAEDALLSVIASFIGHIHSHHIDSHPSSHAYLIELTRETVDRVRELLTIVEAVGRQAGSLGVRTREVEGLKQVRNDLYEQASHLVEVAEAVANAPFSDGGSEQYDTDKAGLLQFTTQTLRSGSECARVVRKCVPDTEDDAEPPSSATAHLSPVSQRGYQGIGLGIRGGPQSIQRLQRRATSLTHLHKRFNTDGARTSSQGYRRNDDDDNEEIVADSSAKVTTPVGANQLPPRFSSRFSGPFTADFDGRGSVDFKSHSRSTSMADAKRHGEGANEIDLTNDEPDITSSSTTVSRPPTLTSFSSQSHTSVSQVSTTSPFPQSTSSSGLSELHATPALPDTPANGDSAIIPLDPTIEGLKAAAKNFQPPPGPAPARPPPPPTSPALSVDGKNEDGDLRFWVVSHDYDPREVAFNSDGTLVGGTLRVLIEKLTPVDGLPDRTFTDTFWFTFRLFSSPEEVLDTFIQRFNIAAPPVVAGLGDEALAMWAENKQKPVRYRVIICIKTWLDHHWRPGTDEAVIDQIEAFLNSEVMKAVPLASRAQDSLRKRLVAKECKDGEGSLDHAHSIASAGTGSISGKSMERTRSTLGTVLSPNPNHTVPTPVISKALHAQLSKNPQPNVLVTDFDTLELARQLTIMESKLFAAVAPEDLLQTGKKNVPELKALSTLSNQITGWVTDVILNEQDTKHRGALLKFYIKLADKCLVLNNFSTLFAVLAGLNSSTIMRLKNTWAVLNVKYRLLMDRLRGVIEHTKNHAAYRARLREVTGPCLPFLGLILSDITFTQDGNPNTRPSTISPDLQLINQDKFSKLGRIATEFKRYQTPFDLKELEHVQTYLARVLADRGSRNLDALYRKSLLLEPRQGSERLSSAVEKPGWLGARLQV